MSTQALAVALAVLFAAIASGAVLLLWVERRRLGALEQRVERNDQDHERRAKARFAFLGSMAHELRTPLAAIIGYQELLSEGIYGPLDERTGEAIGRIGRAATQLAHLIDGMVELVNEGAGDLELEKLMPSMVLQDVFADLAVVARDAGLGFSTDLPSQLPQITSDPRRLHRAVYLATFAAIRATSKGELALRAAAADGRLLVTVRGGALSPAALPPAEAARDEEHGPHHGHAGASLRLTIARAAARTLGGDLTASPDGEGSRLELTFADLTKA